MFGKPVINAGEPVQTDAGLLFSIKTNWLDIISNLMLQIVHLNLLNKTDFKEPICRISSSSNTDDLGQEFGPPPTQIVSTQRAGSPNLSKTDGLRMRPRIMKHVRPLALVRSTSLLDPRFSVLQVNRKRTFKFLFNTASLYSSMLKCSEDLFTQIIIRQGGSMSRVGSLLNCLSWWKNKIFCLLIQPRNKKLYQCYLLLWTICFIPFISSLIFHSVRCSWLLWSGCHVKGQLHLH